VLLVIDQVVLRSFFRLIRTWWNLNSNSNPLAKANVVLLWHGMKFIQFFWDSMSLNNYIGISWWKLKYRWISSQNKHFYSLESLFCFQENRYGIQVSRVMSLKTSHISLFVLVPCAGTKLMKIEHI